MNRLLALVVVSVVVCISVNTFIWAQGPGPGPDGKRKLEPGEKQHYPIYDGLKYSSQRICNSDYMITWHYDGRIHIEQLMGIDPETDHDIWKTVSVKDVDFVKLLLSTDLIGARAYPGKKLEGMARFVEPKAEVVNDIKRLQAENKALIEALNEIKRLQAENKALKEKK